MIRAALAALLALLVVACGRYGPPVRTPPPRPAPPPASEAAPEREEAQTPAPAEEGEQ